MCYEGECKCKNKRPKRFNAVAPKPKIEPEPEKAQEQPSQSRIDIAKRMVSARKMQGLSLEEASKLFGWTKQNLNRYELAHFAIDSETLVKFSKAYNLPTSFFLRKPMDLEFEEIKVHKLKHF